MVFRFDFVVHANPNVAKKKHDHYNYEENQSFDPLKNLDGKPYQHNLGVFPIRFEGTLMCETSYISGEALLVYHKPGTQRKTAETELTALHKEYRDPKRKVLK